MTSFTIKYFPLLRSCVSPHVWYCRSRQRPPYRRRQSRATKAREKLRSLPKDTTRLWNRLTPRLPGERDCWTISTMEPNFSSNITSRIYFSKDASAENEFSIPRYFSVAARSLDQGPVIGNSLAAYYGMAINCPFREYWPLTRAVAREYYSIVCPRTY